MYDLLFAPFYEFEFMQRAMLGCLVLSLSAPPIGTFLIFRRMSLMGDAMAHAILPGAAIGFLFAGLSVTAMTLGGLVAGCLVAVLSGVAVRKTAVSEDSSLASFYLTALALGVMVISVKGSNIDLLHVLFGSILALNDEALILLVFTSLTTLFTLTLLYRPLVMECVDAVFLNSISSMGTIAHYAFLILVVLNLVAGFHALGTLMSVGLMVLPASIARYWLKKLEPIILFSCAVALVACVTGLLLSYFVHVPSGPTIIMTLGIFFVLSFLFGTQNGLVTSYFQLRFSHKYY